MYVISNTNGGANIFDLLEAVDDLLLQVGWVREEFTTREYDGNNRLDYCIWRGTGDGNDKIYLQGRVPYDNIQDLYLDSMAGYDDKLYYFEQPGSIQQWLKSDGESFVRQPMFTVPGNERFYYFLFADTYRLIAIVRAGIIYESCYMGFINPVSSERQFPYPMYVAGNGVAGAGSWSSNVQGSFIFPRNNSGFLRRADGTWRAFDATMQDPDPASIGTVFPYNAHNRLLVPNYKKDDAINQDNFLLIPVILHTNNPIDMSGVLRGVFWISGTRDVAAEQIVVYGNEQYMVFDTKMERAENTYFCVHMGIVR